MRLPISPIVRICNLGPMLHRFEYIAGFCAFDPTLFYPNFGDVPVGTDGPYWGQAEHKP